MILKTIFRNYGTYPKEPGQIIVVTHLVGRVVARRSKCRVARCRVSASSSPSGAVSPRHTPIKFNLASAWCGSKLDLALGRRRSARRRTASRALRSQQYVCTGGALLPAALIFQLSQSSKRPQLRRTEATPTTPRSHQASRTTRHTD